MGSSFVCLDEISSMTNDSFCLELISHAVDFIFNCRDSINAVYCANVIFLKD